MKELKEDRVINS